MDSNYELFVELVKKLDEEGALHELVLIGSWCLYVYKEHYNNPPEIPQMRTMDVDFFVPKPRQVKTQVDVAEVLDTLGYEWKKDRGDGLIKFFNQRLDVEFISPLGRDESPVEVKSLNINTQALKYLDKIGSYVESMSFEGLQIKVPEVGSFVLHKALIGPMRSNELKKEKDALTVKELTAFLFDRPELLERTKEIYDRLPKKWKPKILDSLDLSSPKLKRYLDGK